MALPANQNQESCLNCGTSLGGPGIFCPKCGQKVRDTPLPVKDFLGDFLQDYFTVDSKFFRSIRHLLLSPGTMTRSFNEGKRLRYIAPFRFYIFVSFIYFFLLALSTRETNFNFMKPKTINAEAQLSAIDSLVADTALMANRALWAEAYQALRAAALVDSLNEEQKIFVTLDENAGADGGRLQKLFESRKERIEENPELFKQAMFKASSIGVFFLLPLFAIGLMLLHLRRSSFYVNHLVLSVHYHTFLFLTFSLYIILGMWSDPAKHWVFLALVMGYVALTITEILRHPPQGKVKKALAVVMLLIFLLCLLPPILSGPGDKDLFLVFALASLYLTLSLINAYKQSFLRAVAKSIIIIPMYIIMISLTLVAVAIVGVFLA